MKKILLTLAFVPISALSAFAGDLWLGAGFDTTFTTISGQSDWKSKTGFGGEARFEWGLTDQFSLEFQPGYLNQAVKGHVNAYSTTQYVCVIMGPLRLCSNLTSNHPAYDWERSYGTMNVPVLAKFKFLKKGVTPYAVAGPTLDLPLSAKYHKTVDGGSDSESDFKDELSGVGLGLAAGLGVDVPLGGAARVFVEGQYQLGLTDAYKEESAVGGKFRTILVKVGVDFRLGKHKS